MSLPGAHASLRAERGAFKQTRRKFNFIVCERLYAAKRDACAPSENNLFYCSIYFQTT